MKTFAIDANNDLCLNTGGQLAFAENMQAVLNVCQHVAQAIKGEMIFATSQGMPNFQAVWNGAPKLLVWEAVYRARIQNVTGVTGIENLTITQKGDTVTYQATISTIYGTGNIQEDMANG